MEANLRARLIASLAVAAEDEVLLSTPGADATAKICRSPAWMSPGVTHASPIEPREFRDRMGRYASGITVVGGLVADEPAGFTCQSFYSVSSTPALVSFCVMNSSTSWPRIRPGGRFSVNVLAEGQEQVSHSFARSGGPKWAAVDWMLSPAGNPLVAGSLMWLDCTVFAEHEAGDHHIVIGEVKTMSPADWHASGTPLLYFKGAYRHLRHDPSHGAAR